MKPFRLKATKDTCKCFYWQQFLGKKTKMYLHLKILNVNTCHQIIFKRFKSTTSLKKALSEMHSMQAGFHISLWEMTQYIKCSLSPLFPTKLDSHSRSEYFPCFRINLLPLKSLFKLILNFLPKETIKMIAGIAKNLLCGCFKQ